LNVILNKEQQQEQQENSFKIHLKRNKEIKNLVKSKKTFFILLGDVSFYIISNLTTK